MKKIVLYSLILSLLILSLVLPHRVWGQGTFNCKWIDGWGCLLENSENCDPDFIGDVYRICKPITDEAICNNTKNQVCMYNGDPTVDCENINCPSGKDYFGGSVKQCCKRTGSGALYECEKPITATCPEYYILNPQSDKCECLREDLYSPPPVPVVILNPQTCGNCISYDDCRKGGKPVEECLAPCGIQTALGCFPSEPQAMITWLVKLFIPLAAGIAFLLMVYGAFLLMTSSGDPEKVKKGSEILFSALAGLLFIIFSVFLLRLIGVTILAIPGFG